MKSKLNIVILGLLVFVLGGVAGAVSYSLYRDHINPAPAGMSMNPDDVLDGIARDLKLDSKQKEILRAIFQNTRQEFEQLYREFAPRYDVLNRQYGPQYEEINREYLPRFEAIRNRSDEEIKKMLKPAQRARYEEFLRKAKAAMHPPVS